MEKSELFICPMHKDVKSKKNGFCSKCGMELQRSRSERKGNKSIENNAHNHTDHHKMMAEDFKKRFFIVLPLTIIVLLLSPKIQLWFGFSVNFLYKNFVLFILGSVIAIYGGKPFFVASLDELKSRNWGMMTLVTLAVLTGYSFSVAATFIFPGDSLWWEISTLVLAFLFGHWMEMKAVLGTGRALKELARLIPATAHKVIGKNIKDVATESLLKDDRVLVKPGEKLPADGIVIKGESAINESMITGESRPVDKKVGNEVIGGTINSDGSLIIEVTKTGSESALSQIMDLIKQAQETKPAVQKLADKAANWLTVIAIVVGLSTFIYWFFINPQGIIFAITLAISVIVITCPHALGLAIPTVSTITSSLAARSGILIRNMTGLETAKKLDYIVLDKTGTLTTGGFAVSKIIKFSELTRTNILKLAASVEINSEHSIAKGIVKSAKEKNIRFSPASKFKAIAGKGARGKVGTKTIILGNIEMLKNKGVEIPSINKMDNSGTIVYVALRHNKKKSWELVGAIILEDKIRKESKKAIEAFHKMGIKVAMLTGDKKKVAEKVGMHLGIDTVFAEVLPKDKVNIVKQLQKKGFIVGMVGDGINDAPSLTQAHIGIAIGAGTSVAIESAEIVLVRNNPLDIVKVITLSKKTDIKMKQNLAWATGYNVLAIPAAAGVFYSFGILLRPEWGALIMSASSIIVVANALQLSKAKI
jgi:Cu2+-exporting ATPase